MQAIPFSHGLFPASNRNVVAARTSTYALALGCCSSSLVMDEDKFVEASKHGNLIPLQSTIFSDHLTPVLAYRCLVKQDDYEAPSFLFESVQPGFGVGRYSMVGAEPCMEIVAKEHSVTILDHHTGKLTKRRHVKDPMAIPRCISEVWKPAFTDDLPHTFCGGWVGYFSYDTVRYVENKKLSFLRAPKDDRNLADIQLGLYDDVIVLDHVEKKAHVIHWVQLDQYSSVLEAYLDGKKRLEILVSKVQGIKSPRLSPGYVDFCTHEFGPSLIKGNMTNEEYKNAVLQAKEHIVAGDIFQIILSQRFEKRTFADPFEVYRALRIVNPSPSMAYIQGRGCILVASSPEILTHTKKVSGELLDHLTSWDALRASLPVGTVIGSPKVKAMELIDQLEVARRGPYGGGFGGISFSGDMDIAVTLRTMVFLNGARCNTMYSYTDARKRKEWVVHLQSGAGIVADSDPEEEQIECENQVAGLCQAIDLAESAFVKGEYKPPLVKINGSVPDLFSRVQSLGEKLVTWKEKVHANRN